MFEVVMLWFTAAQQEIWGKCACDVSWGSWVLSFRGDRMSSWVSSEISGLQIL